MPLGVGGATTFAMGSNHQTANNHNFRDTASFDVAKQTRVKCTYCGCWATKGKDCGQCKRPTGPVKVPRNNNVKVEPLVKPAAHPQPTGELTPRKASVATSAKPDNANAHKFREEEPFDPSKQTKIKCQFCGCWAKKGVPCTLCKRVTTK